MTVPVTDKTWAALVRIAERTKCTEEEVIATAVAAYEERVLFAEMDVRYEHLQADSRAWSDYLRERSAPDEQSEDQERAGSHVEWPQERSGQHAQIPWQGERVEWPERVG